MAFFYDGSKYLSEEDKKIIKERKKASNKMVHAQVKDALIAAGIVVGLNATILSPTLMGGLIIGAGTFAGIKATKFVGREIKKHRIKKREKPKKEKKEKEKISKDTKSLMIHGALAAAAVALPSYIFGVGTATIVGAGLGGIILAKDLLKLGVKGVKSAIGISKEEEESEKTR